MYHNTTCFTVLYILNFHLYHDTTYTPMIPEQLKIDVDNPMVCTTYMRQN